MAYRQEWAERVGLGFESVHIGPQNEEEIDLLVPNQGVESSKALQVSRLRAVQILKSALSWSTWYTLSHFVRHLIRGQCLPTIPMLVLADETRAASSGVNHGQSQVRLKVVIVAIAVQQ